MKGKITTPTGQTFEYTNADYKAWTYQSVATFIQKQWKLSDKYGVKKYKNAIVERVKNGRVTILSYEIDGERSYHICTLRIMPKEEMTIAEAFKDWEAAGWKQVRGRLFVLNHYVKQSYIDRITKNAKYLKKMETIKTDKK